MSVIDNIPKHALKVVKRANASGALDRGELTMSAARKLVCESMGLEETALDGPKEKAATKEAILEAIAAVGDDVEAEQDDAEEEDDEADGTEDSIVEQPPKKRTKEALSTKKAPARKPSKKSSSRKEAAQSDGGESEPEDEDFEEDDDESEASYVEESPKKAQKLAKEKKGTSAKLSTSKSSSKRKAPVSREDIDSDSEAEEKTPQENKRNESEEPPSPASSALSSVYDEPPSKRRQSGSKNSKANGKKAAKDPNEGLSPDEARVADLKRIVVACGVRKQWSKEFADCPTPRSQISHLLSLLQSLGMKGTPTMGKAKSLKQKRELAAELNDVQEFAANRGVDTDIGRSRRSAARRVQYTPESDAEEPAKDSAMAAVMDFLDDGSASESD